MIRRSIKTKILVYVLIISIIPLMFIQYIRFKEVKESIEEKEIAKIENLYENIENITKSFFSHIKVDVNILTEIVESEINKKDDIQVIKKNLEKFVESRQYYYSEVSFIDDNGMEVINIQTIDGEKHHHKDENEKFFKSIKDISQERLYFGEMNKCEGTYNNTLFKSIYKDSKLIGHVKIRIRINTLIDRINSYLVRNSYDKKSIILNKDNIYISHPNLQKNWTKVEDKKLLSRLKLSKDKYVIKENEQIIFLKKITLFNESSEYINMLLIVDQDKYIHENINQRLLLEIVSFIAILITVGILITIYLTKPILKLTSAVEEIGKGNFSINLDINSGDEIELLGQKIEEMANQLRYMYSNMERLVENRTKELHNAHVELRQLANTDSLTGLYNRHYFNKFIENYEADIQKHNKDFIIFIIDIDKFKYINDHYGHNVGDKVLIEIATLLKECINQGDVVVRYGGDEFLIALVDADIKRAEGVKNYIEDKVNEWNKKRVVLNHDLTLSIGYEKYTPQQTIEQTIKKADEKMYKHKKSKR